ncbi:MAG TPA: hypothetical protein VFK50_05785 [Sphingomicrobium sp.]|nr:hypothetical protein [Sphingomicrobium sp.]
MRYRAFVAIFMACFAAGGAAAPPPSVQCESAPADSLGPLPMRDGPAQL